MSNTRPVLHFVAGKVGAGKTTLARKLALEVPAVLICEDQWIASLGGEVKTLQDYVRAAARCRKLLVPHLRDILRVGASVVLDFAGNTARDRAWVRSIFEPAGADHVLHVLDVPETLCLERLRQRNAERPEGLFWGEVSEALFHEVTKYYVPPSEEEGFRVVRHNASRDL
ncbi:ATP-binding protein [Archangium gephyra]|uniref:AAA family ATPase n=1 Tax=Archangium gephyra TaxID=48 RepID=UPI0035D3EAC5